MLHITEFTKECQLRQHNNKKKLKHNKSEKREKKYVNRKRSEKERWKSDKKAEELGEWPTNAVWDAPRDEFWQISHINRPSWTLATWHLYLRWFEIVIFKQ